MFDILFSFQFIGIAFLLIVLSIAIAFACTLLHKQLLYTPAGEWMIEHIYCPLSKVLLMMLMAFLLFPLIETTTRYGQLFELFSQEDFVIDMMNILFFGGLLLSFLPLLSHSALATPILGCIASGLLFLHHVAIPAQIEFNWLPSANALSYIATLMLLTYLLNRWLSERVSEWIDQRFIVTGSKVLVSDINTLILQIPIVLAYGHSLTLQLAG